MLLETVGLGKAAMANVTLVRFLAGVNAKMTLQFEPVSSGVGAVRALVRFFTGVTPHVTLQLAQFNRSVIALGTTMPFLMSVSVTHVT